VVFQIQVLDCFLNYSLDFSCADAFDERVEFESLLNTQHGEYRIVLGTISDQLAGFLELLLHVKALDSDLSCCRGDFSCKTFEGR